MPAELAPIALFVYNRPEHTKSTIQALLANPEAARSELFVFSDAAKNDAAMNSVEDVRKYIRQVKGFAEINIEERTHNHGLANSIIQGVSELCEKFGRVIVLEDDLQASPFFLAYMNRALDIYRADERVGSISGYMYPVRVTNQVFFRAVPQSWGWATWQDAWALMQTDGQLLLEELEQLGIASQFDNAGHQPLLKMLKDQIKGKNNSWYVRWAASLFVNQKLTLMPNETLVKNIGIDGTGTHCAYWKFNPYDGEVADKEINLECAPPILVKNPIEKKLERYFRKVRFIRYVNFFYRFLRAGRHRVRMKR